ncbi:MAG: tyrosine-type recombinase/integrase [Lachnospiraceae bacterium]|nr:tyrosine-type recombinase/integrase [Lachnospiraceae bacterium]
MQFKQYRDLSEANLDAFCKRILTDHIADRRVEVVKKENEPTFAEVYEMFFEWKFGEHAAKKLSKSSVEAMKSAYGNCKQLHDRIFRELQLPDLQKCINDCPLKKASLEMIATLLKQMYKFAEPRNLCDRNYAQYITLPDSEDDEHGIPFSDDDLRVLWRNKDDPTVEFLLIMCYSGYRISAYKTIEVNTSGWYFRGGVKTKSSKDRVVPIHTSIRPLVESRLSRDGKMLRVSDSGFRKAMYSTLEDLKLDRHTPHDCRHTFSRLCEQYGVNENDRKRMMGHSFGADITNGVYGHRTLEDLRAEIEKIRV